MKKEKISEIISNIDESFIEESAMAVKKKIPVYKYVSIAACLAVMIIAGIFISQSDFVTPPPVKTEETTSNESGGGENKVPEIAPAPEIVTEPAIETVTGGTSCMKIPPWDALTTSEKYREVTLSGITYYSQVQKIDEASVLSFIEDTTMQGYDPYEDKTYTENAKIYSITSISTECAVAVKIGTEDEYYVYVNSYYEPDTLGDLISDLDLKNTVSFGKAYKDYTDYDKKEFVSVVFADFDDSIVWNMLLTDTEVKNIEYDRFKEMLISVSVDIPLLGYKNISLGVTKDGYIVTNIMSTQKCFFIGTEKAEAFEAYISENVAFKEMVTVYENPDGTIPGKGEVQTSPAYDPSAGQSTPPYDPEAGRGQSVPGYDPDTEVTCESVTSPAFESSWRNNEPVTIPKNGDQSVPAINISPMPDGTVTATTEVSP